MTEEQNALLIFLEELGELAVELLLLQKLASKAIRFGIDEKHDLPATNHERIQAEWNDLLGSVKHLANSGIELKPDIEAIAEKVRKIEKYTEYSRRLGTVRSAPKDAAGEK